MNLEQLRERATALRFYGLLAHWPEVNSADWLAPLVQWEEDERTRRSLERRLRDARIGRFKPLTDFDWAWPCLLYTSPSPRDRTRSRMPSSA